jgi:hypothetical protein
MLLEPQDIAFSGTNMDSDTGSNAGGQVGYNEEGDGAFELQDAGSASGSMMTSKGWFECSMLWEENIG